MSENVKNTYLVGGWTTHLKNISQIGNLPQIGVNMKNIWNHQTVTHWQIIGYQVSDAHAPKLCLEDPRELPSCRPTAIHIVLQNRTI